MFLNKNLIKIFKNASSKSIYFFINQKQIFKIRANKKNLFKSFFKQKHQIYEIFYVFFQVYTLHIFHVYVSYILTPSLLVTNYQFHRAPIIDHL